MLTREEIIVYRQPLLLAQVSTIGMEHGSGYNLLKNNLRNLK